MKTPECSVSEMNNWIKKGLIFSDHHAQLPVADVYDSFIRIYYSTRIEKRSRPTYIDVDKNDPTRIIRKNTVPILELGRPGSFDWAGVMPTAIITHDNRKYLYYIGWSVRQDVPYHNNLGLAVSDDNGENWTKFSEGPIFHTSHKEPGYIGTIDVQIDDGIWKGWYLSCREWIKVNGIMEPIYDIKYATSVDGINWEPSGITSIELEGKEGGISAARVIKTKQGYKMWFSVRNKSDYRTNINHSYRIKTAISKNGIDWIRNESIEIGLSAAGWDNIMTCYPYIIRQSDLQYIMFYNGNGFGSSGIGCAIQTF